MDDLPQKSLDVLKSLARSGYAETRPIGDPICSALERRGYVTKRRIAVFSEEGALMPAGTQKGPNMTYRQVIEINEAGRIRAAQP